MMDVPFIELREKHCNDLNTMANQNTIIKMYTIIYVHVISITNSFPHKLMGLSQEGITLC